jgi:hypothetical protein
MSVLLRRENLTYREQVVYTAGHAFINCTFDGCTIVVREATGVLERCTFVGCVWHLDVFVSDRDHWAPLQNVIGPLLLASLPAAATAVPAQVGTTDGR